MGKSIDYTRFLGEENTDKIRVFFEKDRGKVTYFIIHYYSLVNSRWRSIMRIDTCHGYAHKHTFHIKRKEYTQVLSDDLSDLNIIFTEFLSFVSQNFEKIKENFLS